MPICNKCNKQFANQQWINKKRVNLSRRKYCLECSPLGLHNTRKIHIYDKDGYKICQTCNRTLSVKHHGNKCHSCIMKSREERIENILYNDIVGNECWLCGYDTGRSMLDFHHMDRLEKNFCVNKRTICQFSWKRIVNEIQKCILVCCRCHREIEFGFIDNNIVNNIYKNKWKEITKSGIKNCPKIDRVTEKICTVCQTKYKEPYKYRTCQSCREIKNNKRKNYPNVDELKNMLQTMTWTAIGKKYKVSDNAVRKWAKKFKIL